MRIVAIALLSVFAALFHASPVSACSCASETAFDETVRRTDVVVTGRVTAIGALKSDDDPESIDLDVEWVAKGGVTASSIRVWNRFAGSSCGGELKALKVGDLVALALTVVEKSASPFGDDPAIDALVVHPAVGDFAVVTPCGEGHKRFRTRRDRDRWIANALK